jgi:phage terminase large subunit
MQALDVAGSGVVLGCDIARFGADESVVAARRGERLLWIEAWSGRDLMETTGRIAKLAREHRAVRINVDEIGMGGGVVDRLKELQLPVYGINVGDTPYNREKYVNLRAELFDGLATRFREGLETRGAVVEYSVPL